MAPQGGEPLRVQLPTKRKGEEIDAGGEPLCVQLPMKRSKDEEKIQFLHAGDILRHDVILKLYAGSIQDKVVLGTDCAGLDPFRLALRMLDVGNGDVVYAFASDRRGWARRFVKLNNIDLCIMYDDITKRSNDAAPYVDIYCASLRNSDVAWMTPYELSHGVADPSGNHNEALHILNYIKKKLPKIFLLESRSNLNSTRMTNTMALVFDYLKKLTTTDGDLAYHVRWNQMCARRDGGVPQLAQRLFFAGVLKTASPPEPLSTNNPLFLPQLAHKSLLNVLEPYVAPDVTPNYDQPLGLTQAQLSNYKKVMDMFEGSDPGQSWKEATPPTVASSSRT